MKIFDDYALVGGGLLILIGVPLELAGYAKLGRIADFFANPKSDF